jgi:hypothetical protein
VKKTPTLDQNGQLKAYTITLKQDKTGKTWDQEVTPQALMTMGMAGLSPDKQFEMQYKTLTDAAAARAKYAAQDAHDERVFKRDIAKKGIDAKIDEAKDARVTDRDLALEDKRHGNRMEEDNNKTTLETANIGAKEKAKVQAKMDALKAAGYSDDDIKGLMPTLLNADTYKKPTSPAETRRMAFDARMKGDFSFANKSSAEQNKIIDSDIATITGGAAPTTGKTANPFANPAASGLPASGAQPAGKPQGIPVYDTKTGQVVYQ